MKIYDITHELFQAEVFPGDPIPTKKKLMSIEGGDPCQLTELTVGSHTGTHMDAPRHFIEGGKAAKDIDLEKCIGPCKVVEEEGKLTAEHIRGWVEDGTRRLLIKGNIEVTETAAKEMAAQELWLVGVEGMTIGSYSCLSAVHKTVLGAEIAVLENANLSRVPEGNYFISALPLKMAGVDGSPVRAVLYECE